MVKFELVAKIRFEAVNMDDAFMKLSKHFSDLAREKDSHLFEVAQDGEGKIEIIPVETDGD